ncbi:MAG: iron-siderophore ABC transporter substrate-binding protein [Cyanobacteria bacterium J06639_16]
MQTIIQAIQAYLSSRPQQGLNRQRRFLMLMGVATLAAACTRSHQSEVISNASTSGVVKRVQHALGETEVSTQPSRVVVWGYTLVEAVVALGIQPIGMPGIMVNEMMHLALDTTAITDIDASGQPNLEAIAVLKPDLILTTQPVVADNYPRLSQIAPTVVFDIDERLEWRELTRLCGDVLGKQTEAQKLSTDYEAKLLQFIAQLPPDLAKIQASVVFISPGQIRTLAKASFPGTVLEEAGILRPPGQAEGPGLRNISLESLNEIDGDVMFLLTPQSVTELAAGVRAEIDRIQASPLWPQLKAVQTNQIYEVGPHWALGNYIAANLILDDLLAYMGN